MVKNDIFSLFHSVRITIFSERKFSIPSLVCVNILFLLMAIILIFIFVEKNNCVYLKNYIMPYTHVTTVFS